MQTLKLLYRNVASWNKTTNLLCLYSKRNLTQSFSSSAKRLSVDEFFEPRDNWRKREIRSGKEWGKEELRLKSNVDLWKLWYVLYKEKNMLLTMEEEYKRLNVAFPNPERVFKVDLSMENLEAVVNERNRAYNLVEHGVTGEAPVDERYSGLGLKYQRKYEEHYLPHWMNDSFHMSRRERDPFKMSPKTADFLNKYWEKNRKQKRGKLRAERSVLRRIRSTYPNSKVWRDKGEAYKLKNEDLFHTRMSD